MLQGFSKKETSTKLKIILNNTIKNKTLSYTSEISTITKRDRK
jgi:hypothetical protein